MKFYYSVFTFFILSSTVFSQWQLVTTYPGSQAKAPFVFTIGEKAYIGGGANSSDFWEYDTKLDTWTKLGDAGCGPRAFAYAFSMDGKGYVGSGSPKGDTASAVYDFWEYDPATDTWTQKADLTFLPHATAYTIPYDGKGYVGGGWYKAGSFSDMYAYNPSTNAWAVKKICPEGPLSASAYFVLDDKLYVGTGSESKRTNTDRFWEYDPEHDSWIYHTPFPGGVRQGAVGFAAGGKGYIGCGVNGRFAHPTVFTDFWEFDPVTNEWREATELAWPADSTVWMKSFVINNTAYVGVGTRLPGGAQSTRIYKHAFGSLITAYVKAKTVNFGAVTSNSTRDSVITIANGGSSSYTVTEFTVTGTDATDFAITAPALPLEVAAGESFDVTIHFTPCDQTSKNAMLQVHSNAANTSLFEITLMGTGGEAKVKIDVDPVSYDFGTVDEGTSHSAQFEVRSTGELPLIISDIQLANNGANGYSIPEYTLPMIIDPGESEFLTVTYFPEQASTYTAQLRITSNASNGTQQSIPLQGAAQDVDRQIQCSATSIAYQTTPLGTSAEATVTVSSANSESVTITKIVFINDADTVFTSESASLPLEIQPGTSAAVTAYFTPKEAKAYSGNLVIQSNADNTPQINLPVTGTGYIPQIADIELDPEPVDFGAVKIAADESCTFSVKSIGGVSLHVQQISITGAGAAAFTLGSISTPFTLMAGGSKKVPVTFTPPAEGKYTATIQVVSDAEGKATYEVEISGYGVPNEGSAAEISQTAVDFGENDIAATSVMTVVLSSTGTESFEIQSATVDGVDANAFTFTGFGIPYTVDALGAVTISLAFTPTKEGDHTATLRLGTSAQTGGAIDVQLQGAGKLPSAVEDVVPAGTGVVSLYPNPLKAGQDIQYIFASEVPEPGTLYVYDVYGRMVQSVELMHLYPGAHPLSLLSGLRTGLYYVHFRTGRFQRTVPLVIHE